MSIQQDNHSTPFLIPISVLVNWSESSIFNAGQTYEFKEFERKALEVALHHPLGGYEKTNITVLFNYGDEHQCRLDLGCDGNDTGFADHCLSILEYHEKHQGDIDKPWLSSDSHHHTLILCIQTYCFDKEQVTQARNKAKLVTEVAKQQERDNAQKRREQEERK